jgi:diguanylate cyclase (GGDEF)-like protein
MEASPDGILVVDTNNKIIAFNRRFAEVWQIPRAALLSGDDEPVLAHVTAQIKDPQAFAARVKFLYENPGESSDDEIETTDGRVFDRHSVSLLTDGGEYLGRAWFFSDNTERKAAAAKLQFANVMLKTQLEASPDGILAVNASRRVLSYNQRFADICRISVALLETGDAEAVLNASMSLIVDPEMFADRTRFLIDHAEEPGCDELETTDGRFIERHSRGLRSNATDNLGRVWFLRDVTARRNAEAQAIRLARFDGLTGLANRSVFVEAIEQAIAFVKRGSAGFAVMYLDLDRFKYVNDTLGHPAGDALLVEVANRLRASTRETDTIGRFGGDEFAIVATDIDDPADAASLAEKLVKAIAAPFAIAGNIIHVGASIGIDLHSPRAADAETLLSHADVALYRAKTEGRGTYQFFTAAMDREIHDRVTLSGELREALCRNELFLVYQPQVANESGRITGVEGLLRWRHPTRGLLEPEDFVAVAETAGLIGLIGRFVLWTACRQATAWKDSGLPPIRVSVNVSALQFKAALALETDVVGALNETGLPPNLLELELTEAALMGASRDQNDVLLRLRQLGVRLSIDEFGTGYSTLNYLRRFPVDHIKIAKSFIQDVETEAGDASIVRAILGLAREFGIGVIADGIAACSQLNLLQSWGCSEMQGFYFASPLPADEIADLLQSGGTIQPLSSLPVEVLSVTEN